ncbi:helix-turn-helix domain-containing protein [Micromonospora sp. WMMD710]|uniref:helix-turn-helix domain-containing protein n=1 Tax=Micromonospora sp. WMMD710 TaxID=3016085 RepID=UPI0024167E38|nr:helix-turn-helix domain-containing protein [Micromonospora sp. WMMD710]MDG4756310.1 helix-turn-helix domain-containing protein [Micromonospora sp. WMMD710]MDG4762407.1 helix-turn-helix domain-containing protein [Micromonospora sp. WMMD710]MDG4762453.1 helix-turn-helix domain-containing protein [Micromonospora sp. WMMD710]MDG4762488.1 helix-turn-helix domain-containing protein [Micromonospora sp. WMMD710]
MRTSASPSDGTATDVGRRVLEEMDRQCIRQTTVAVRLGISQQAVSRRIRGVVPFNVSELEEIGRLLGVPAAQFLSPSLSPVA